MQATTIGLDLAGRLDELTAGQLPITVKNYARFGRIDGLMRLGRGRAELPRTVISGSLGPTQTDALMQVGAGYYS